VEVTVDAYLRRLVNTMPLIVLFPEITRSGGSSAAKHVTRPSGAQ
jgi:hypothetical protein